MPAKRLKKFLDNNCIKYIIINHSPAYTTQEIAEIVHIPAKEFAKTVIIKIDDQLAMVVVPAHLKVNLEKIRQIADAQNVEMASETEFEQHFPECELGAMPPFGNLYDLPVYVSEELTKDKQVAFNAGTHSEIIKLVYQDYANLVSPIVVNM